MIVNNFLNINILFVIKIASLILMGMYLVFALIIVRQIRLLTKTLTLGFEAIIIMLGYLHLAFALLVFFAALILI